MFATKHFLIAKLKRRIRNERIKLKVVSTNVTNNFVLDKYPVNMSPFYYIRKKVIQYILTSCLSVFMVWYNTEISGIEK